MSSDFEFDNEIDRRIFEKEPKIQKLIASPQFHDAISQLEAFERGPGARTSVPSMLLGWVAAGLTGPRYSEQLTSTERRDLSQKIIRLSRQLYSAMKPLLAEGYAFQALFDSLALDAACDYAEWQKEKFEAELNEETVDHCRFAIYRFLMDNLDELFNTIEVSADSFLGRRETILKKPNDPNAPRLFFIRTLTRGFMLEFKTPMRAATLSLTSVFFDCDDIDEAALSRLAPVNRRKSVPSSVQDSMPSEAWKQIVELPSERKAEFLAAMEETIAWASRPASKKKK